MRIMIKRLKQELREFHCKVVLHITYHTKFDDEIQRECLRISSIVMD